jgi:hypothetical protein
MRLRRQWAVLSGRRPARKPSRDQRRNMRLSRVRLTWQTYQRSSFIRASNDRLRPSCRSPRPPTP